ncbi:unnamed protein product, partial [Phaeothamnion confervicola]
MRLKNALVYSALVVCLASPALAQDGSVYRAGSETSGGETVNVYTNVGAQRYKRAMTTSGGVIHNLAPKADPAFSTAAQMPKAYSYDESGYRGGPRMIGQADLAALIDKEAKK